MDGKNKDQHKMITKFTVLPLVFSVCVGKIHKDTELVLVGTKDSNKLFSTLFTKHGAAAISLLEK